LILTHIGGPTVLVEVEGWRLLTDPTFDPAGGHYAFGFGTSSDKVSGPSLGIADLPPIDVVLLTHGDNLDAAGRELLRSAGTVVTTVPGARRLGLPAGRGLRAGDTMRLTARGRRDLEVTATPARHGPPLSHPIVGAVVGFALRWPGTPTCLLWVTGDTVLHAPVRRLAASLEVDVLLVHVGGVRFPLTGPVRYTMTGQQAVELIDRVRPRVAVPVHYEGWSHFKDGRESIEQALEVAPAEVRRATRWLGLGTAADVG
jgi:L-ascorbate metabolism protein UlaG (beta-lactamase superfamily)